ncbi:Os11g0587550 [Oryza sativa Japonica Group]|uniref:Os11g0587550 protein n=1 Tax=Oryza sativa subsp. japonica TaxID=39947 RepID=A0A0P0Y3V0_ORYSJ|nr:hypothetical protein EE612_056387 [Oryza sativa]BAT14651.1 Os11g0587550 [Oryza sativa Japonica Group]
MAYFAYLLFSLICSRSSKVLPGSKQPSKNSQTSPLINDLIYPFLYPVQNRSNIQTAFTRKRSMPFPNAQRETLILNLVSGTLWVQSERIW